MIGATRIPEAWLFRDIVRRYGRPLSPACCAVAPAFLRPPFPLPFPGCEILRTLWHGSEMTWTLEDSKRLYNIEGWGIGYFGVNEEGHVTVHPTRDPQDGLDLFDLARDLEAQGVGLPLLLRFSDILRTRIESLSERFRAAIEEYGYQGTYTTVFPIKVNQQRHVVEEIAAYGKRFGAGLEVGSKPELQAALAANPIDAVSARCDLAEALLAADRRDEARREVLAALKIAPSYQRGQDLLLKIVEGK